MADYLQLDGIDDYLQTPSITFNRVVIDAFVHYRTSGAWTCLVSGSGNNLTFNTGGGQSSSGYNTPLTINGSSTFSITNDTRNTIDITTSTATITSSEYLFSNLGSSDFAQVNVYNVKFYNGATLVAHYDMTTGTVQDQSGNGKHATLTGGTWVGSSTPVSVTSVIANATATANNHSVTVQRNVSVSSVIANANPSAIIPVVSASKNVAITSIVANSTSSGIVPVIGAAVNKNITSIAANATAGTLPPTVSTGVNVSVLPTVVNATVVSFAPVISSGSSISHVVANANASANPPMVGAVTTIVGVAASASGQALPPSVTSQKQSNAASVVANSSASASIPVVSILVPNVVIQGKAALASVMAFIPTLLMNVVYLSRNVNISGSISAAVELKGVVIVETSRPPIYLEGDATTTPKELRGEV